MSPAPFFKPIRNHRTRKAIFEFDKLVRRIYTLRYLVAILNSQRNVHRSQNRIEAYHQLRSAAKRN